MSKIVLEEQDLKAIDDLVDHFIKNKHLFLITLNSLEGYISFSEALKLYIHSTKFRIKDPDHLKDKLIRKFISAKEKNEDFEINKSNLFSKINDLVGFRIIHLHTRQIERIDFELKNILKDQLWQIIEGPNARTWDDESRTYFETIGIATSPNPNMYTSVHYIIQPNSSASITCEIQVRTLMEEVWGEVDHTINYPHKTESLSCREQIKALARATSSCSRLVDSIFSTYDDYQDSNLKNQIQEKVSVSKNKPSIKKGRKKL